MKLLIIFIYLITTNFSHALEKPDLKNLVLLKNPKLYKDVIFMDINQKNVNLYDFRFFNKTKFFKSGFSRA